MEKDKIWISAPIEPNMPSKIERKPIFFIHIQKTAGGTLRHFLLNRLPRGSVYPHHPYDKQPLDAYWSVPRLTTISSARMQQLYIFVGHYPYIASQMLDLDVTTLSLLRNPIDRTVSYLRMRAKDPERQNMTAEEIYNHDHDFPMFIQNHQTKIFAFTKRDNPQSFMDIIDITPARFDIAKEHIEQVDILGLQERVKEVYQEVASQLGLVWEEDTSFHVTDKNFHIPQNLLDRIAEDNSFDVDFYDHAVKLYKQRKAARSYSIQEQKKV